MLAARGRVRGEVDYVRLRSGLGLADLALECVDATGERVRVRVAARGSLARTLAATLGDGDELVVHGWLREGDDELPVLDAEWFAVSR